MKRLVSRRVAAGLMATALLSQAACTGRSGSTFTLSRAGANAPGTVYPAADRRALSTFSETLLDGRVFDSATLQGHPAVLTWWGSWCGPCQTEMPQYQVLYERLKTKGVAFVGFDIKDTRSRAQSFVSDMRITFPIVFDEPGRSAMRLGVGNVPGPPFTMLIDDKGRVAAVYLGPQAAPSLSAALNKL